MRCKLALAAIIFAAAPALANPPLDGRLDTAFRGTGLYTKDFTYNAQPTAYEVRDLRRAYGGGEEGGLYAALWQQPNALDPRGYSAGINIGTLANTGTGITLLHDESQLGPLAVTTRVRLLPIYASNGVIHQEYLVFNGLSPQGDTDFVACRTAYDAFGMDPGYGANGCRRIPVNRGSTTSGRQDLLFDAVLDAQNRVVMVGQANSDDVNDPAAVAVRLTDYGGYDASFGTNGVLVFQFARKASIATGVVLDAGGRIVMSGTQAPALPASDDGNFAVARLTPAGDFDASFNSSGVRVLPLDLVAAGKDVALAVDVDSHGAIYLAGSVQDTATTSSPAVYKLDDSGQPVTSYGTDGLYFDHLNAGVQVERLHVGADGSAYLGGQIGGNPPALVSMRVDPRGRTMCPYSTTLECRAEVLFPGAIDQTFTATMLDREGRLWIGGSRTAADGSKSVAVARLLTDRLFADGME